MTVRAEHKWTKTEQAVWIVIASCLFFFETRTLFQDRAEQDEQHAREAGAQKAQFDQVLKQNQQDFAATIKRVDRVFGKAEEAINTETGADSYCYVDADIGPYLWHNGHPTKGLKFFLYLVRIGKYPLRDVDISITDHVKYSYYADKLHQERKPTMTNTSVEEEFLESEKAESESTTHLPPQTLDVNVKSLPPITAMEADKQELTANIDTFNLGEMEEYIEIRKVGDHWSKAILLERQMQRKPDWFKVDQDFPRTKDGHLDVPWPRRVGKRELWDH